MMTTIKKSEALFAQGKIEEANEILSQIIERNPKSKDALNNLGVIAFQRGDVEEAIEYFTRTLEIDPFHRDAILNFSDLLKSVNRFGESIPILENGVAKFPRDEEMNRLLNEARQTLGFKPKIAVMCLRGLESFLGDIIDFLKTRADVRTCYSTNGQEIESAIHWADIVWLEWANEMAIHITNKIPQIKDKKVICRLHGYEVFSEMPAQINWSAIDHLVFVAKHKQEIFNRRFKIQSPTQTIIRNGINIDKFTVSNNKRNTKRLVIIGHLNFRKGIPLLLQFYHELLKADPDYYLYIRGEFQDLRLEMAVRTMIRELSLDRKLEFVNWVEDLNSWLADKSHILSFSLEESFHYTIGNGMAAGLKPLIHAWNESREIWPEEFIFNNIESFLRITLDNVYEPERYRRILTDNALDCGHQFKQIEDLIGDVSAARALPKLDLENQLQEKLSEEKRLPRKSNLVILNRKRKRNVFIIGLRRSGTTIFWETFRQDKRFMCFDEPFRPHLLQHVSQGEDDHKSTMTEYLAKREIILNHWSPILPYQEILSKFVAHQLTYMKALLGTGDNVCIDFVRCHSKIGELRKLDPDALIIHLVRDPRAFVTSHLKPYGKWVSNELPEKFFEYRGWFDYWQYQTICNLMGFREAAHLALLQLWKAFSDIAEGQRPDVTLQFEDFATNSKDTMQSLYEILNLDYPDFDFSSIHAPNAPFKPDSPLWILAMQKAAVPARFVYDLWNQDG
jgi:tetratricopeptide (TPR) repeat protein